MEIIKCWEEEGHTIPDPYRRHIRVMLAPDKRGVTEISFNQALLYPGGRTDYHTHDRPELIYVVSGRGVSVCEGAETPIGPDMALWVRAGEKHQMINTGEETLKLATVFIPGYSAKETITRMVEVAEGARKSVKD
jgi:mannose-6-phosphate isomerase-like protein (cupin superfamily)